ncbi:hypothetical protein E4656_03440 [Natronospirillum operosum]|uniref:BFN domain-containing protein n=1 Tax=Natronospirillum operosum TaxID=2759953 RepID=A0A4Z0WFV3_9GAMM|nr:bifunctional nuclease domain-containing protein [Natronospirillum operosum]TGG95488.1 hypothetical protein E4656_03440 [Natronospirillum operosum]
MRTLILSIALLLTASATLQAREPMEDPDDLVAVELATVGVDPMSGTPLVILREPGSGDVVPISIGPEEALAIIRALESIQTPRPMTHDTAVEVISALGGTLNRIMVDALIDNTYHGVLDIRRDGDPDTPVYVDTRPSDALALAVRTGATILVAPEVLQATRGRDFEGLGDDQSVTALGITVGMLSDEIRGDLDFPDDPGVVVNRAVGQAQEAGIEPGSMILSVNGEAPTTPLEFLELVQQTESDEPAVIRFWYDGEERTIELDTDVPAPEPRRRTAPGDMGPTV